MQWPIELTTRPPTRVAIERVLGKFETEGTVQDVKRDRSGVTQRISQSFYRWDVAATSNNHPNILQTM
jgi:hypothetical protein